MPAHVDPALVPGKNDVRNFVAPLSAKLTGPFRRVSRIPRAARLAAAGTTLAVVVGGTVAFTTLDKDVTLDADGTTSEVSTFAGTVGDVLAAEGITIGEHDIVAPAVTSKLSDGDDIVVRYGRKLTVTVDGEQKVYWTTATTVNEALADIGVRADGAKLSASRSEPLGRQGLDLAVTTPKNVLVVADGAERPLTSTAGTVSDLLGEAGVVVRDGDEVSLDTAQRVTEGLRVQVVRIDRGQSTEVQSIGHGTRTEQTDALFKGEKKVVTPGADGSKTVTFADVSRDGVRVEHTVVGETVDVQPVEAVVQVGTKARPVAVAASSGGGGSVGGGADSKNWGALAACESGGNPSIVSSNGKYHGLYQFSVQTWRGVGGSGIPSQASASEQTYRAKLLYQRSGAGQWPVCGKRL